VHAQIRLTTAPINQHGHARNFDRVSCKCIQRLAYRPARRQDVVDD
jgi:hypothetical protein